MQKTINGIRKWLSARVAAAFWEKAGPTHIAIRDKHLLLRFLESRLATGFRRFRS